MKKAFSRALLCVTTLVAGGAAAQPPAPRPGPEHEMLAKMAGVWEAVITAGGAEAGKGVMTFKMGPGGLWVVSSFEGEFSGQKFTGHGLDGYDPAKQRFVGAWADSMAPSLLVTEGTLDKDKNTMTSTGDGPGPEGKIVKLKLVTEMKGQDNMVFTLSAPDKDNKDQAMITITYTRKK